MDPLPRIVGLSGWDFLVLALSVAMLLVIGFWQSRKGSGLGNFLLGNRGIPWPIACLSFVATEISAVTIIAVPAAVFKTNFTYLEFFIGSAAARILVAIFFIPAFYRADCTSIYQLLGSRLGLNTQVTASIFFFLTRLAGSGVRLYVACLGVSLILGWSFLASLVAFTLVSSVFVVVGGIRAVVWNGAYQAIMFYAAAIGMVIALAWQLPDHWLTDIGHAWNAGKMEVFRFQLDFSDANGFWAASLNAFFIGLTVFGTDQELVQRLLTVDKRRDSQRAIVGTIIAAFPLVCLYLVVGALMWVLYSRVGLIGVPAASGDNALSYLVNQYLPHGLKGLVLAAIVLASIDSPLTSLTSSFVQDIYRPLIRPSESDAHYLRVSRLAILGFAILLGAIAYLCRGVESSLWLAFQVLGVTGGALLGAFLLSLMERRPRAACVSAGMVVSGILCGLLLWASKANLISLGWSWLVVVGAPITIAAAWAMHHGRERRASPAERV